jgi:hypothetical protein
MFQINVLPPQSGKKGERVFYLAPGSNTFLKCISKFVPDYIMLFLGRQYSGYLFPEQNMETIQNKRTTTWY